MTQISTGGYVRHRDRMVQEAVFQDLSNTLIACRWMTGTTTHKVVNPDDPGAGWQIMTTTTNQLLKLLGTREDGSPAEVKVIDFFPEAGGNNDEAAESRKTEVNTFAVDTGQAQEPVDLEMGSSLIEQPYVFTMAFYAESDAVALAVLNDLRDRYQGRLVTDDHLDLYNFNDPSYSDSATPPVCRMEVDHFRYQLSDDASVSAWEVHLYYAELSITDIVDASST